MLEHLFGSKTRFRLLKIFFRSPERSFFVRELTRLLDIQINAIRRELELLIAAGLVIETDTPGHVNKSAAGAGLRKYYRLNTDSILYPEIQALLLKDRVLNEQQLIRQIQDGAGDIDLLLLTGRLVGEADVESDLLIVGNIKERTLEKMVAEYEKEAGFEIRYTIMTSTEFYERRQMMDKFIFSLFETKKILVINKLGV